MTSCARAARTDVTAARAIVHRDVQRTYPARMGLDHRQCQLELKLLTMVSTMVDHGMVDHGRPWSTMEAGAGTTVTAEEGGEGVVGPR